MAAAHASHRPAAGARRLVVSGLPSHNCQHLDADHVGPFGAAAYRGPGIGSVMLYRLLDRLPQKGYSFAWFGETGRARGYYERAGFRVTRVYAVLRREPEPPAGQPGQPPQA